MELPLGGIEFNSAVVVVPASIIAGMISPAFSSKKKRLRNIRAQTHKVSTCEAGADTLKSGVMERVLTAG